MSVAQISSQQLYTEDNTRGSPYVTGLTLPNFTHQDYGAKPRIDEGHRGMAYGAQDYDRGHPHPRPLTDPFHDKASEDSARLEKQKADMQLDIQMLKEKQMKEKMERDDEKRKNYEMLTQQFPWDQNSRGHGAPRKRETDLFLDTLGGPGGRVLRQNGSPNLSDPRYTQQQELFQARPSPRMTPAELEEYRGKLEQVSQDKKLMKEQKRIHEFKNQLDQLKQDIGYDRDDNYRPEFSERRPEQRRSLDLENTRGGAGAPIKDERGKNMTRRPITLSRDDLGESKIREDVPGRPALEMDFLKEDTSPYYPWGGQGGGAPIRDRDGNVRTQIYGKLDGRGADGGEVRRNRRRQEVLYNELKEGERQFKENKEALKQYMKAPQAELADMMTAGRVGKPKRDAITGEISQHHLPNSDVSLLKMNHQAVPIAEKRKLHADLVQAAEDRKNQRELEKLKERQESNAHFQNMDQQWGNFGGGAPKHSMIRKKVNLNNALFYPDHSPPPVQHFDPIYPPTGLGSFDQSPSYQKLYVDSDVRQYNSPDNSPRYVKSTINSSHKNNFEGANGDRFMRGKQAMPPFATGGIY